MPDDVGYIFYNSSAFLPMAADSDCKAFYSAMKGEASTSMSHQKLYVEQQDMDMKTEDSAMLTEHLDSPGLHQRTTAATQPVPDQSPTSTMEWNRAAFKRCLRPRRASWFGHRSTEERGKELSRLTRSHSSPDMVLQTIKEFEVVSRDEPDKKMYRFCCSHAGLFQCRLTGLVLGMEGEGEVLYRTIPWDRNFLEHTGKRPAGPLYQFTCLRGSAFQLHLPHCETLKTLSKGGCDVLSVAQLTKHGYAGFKRPNMITETHVVINICGFSAYGLTKEKQAAVQPICAVVLLLYQPSNDPDLLPIINVLMQPCNADVNQVVEGRRELYKTTELPISTVTRCKLMPKQMYQLSTEPQCEVNPKAAEFFEESTLFQDFEVFPNHETKEVKLMLNEERDETDETSKTVWTGRARIPNSVDSKGFAAWLRSLLPAWSRLAWSPAPRLRNDLLTGEEALEFFKRNRVNLVQKVRNLNPIVDELLSGDYHHEKAAAVSATNVPQEGMRKLLDSITSKAAAEDLYRALLKHEKHVMKDLS